MRIGDIVIDSANLTVWVGDSDVRLQAREFEIFHVLWRARGSFVHRERLFGVIWGGTRICDERIIDVLICRIRKRLARLGIVITTVWGEGHYILAERKSQTLIHATR